MRHSRPFLVFVCATIALTAFVVKAQDSRLATTDVTITGHVVEPKHGAATQALVERLHVPEGFRVSVFASGLGMPRMLAVAEDGTVYVTRRTPGDLVQLRDVDRDGRADEQRVVATMPQLHGVTIHNGRIYVATITDVYSAVLSQAGPVDWQRLITNLPGGGQHPNRTLKVGPDGKLYISIGSTCNECNEPDPRNATLQQFDLESAQLTPFASGLRNTIGFDWHPTTGELWGFDHGIDWLGDNAQHEELNQLVRGGHYGWPFIFDDGRANPHTEPQAPQTIEDYRRTTLAPALMYTAHAAPMQMTFYRGSMFPSEYRGDAFVAMRGSWNRRPPSGYELVRVRFSNGRPLSATPFLSSFLYTAFSGGAAQPQQFGRPVGVVEMPDGALLVGDDTNGMIYRIAYAGAR